jgi:hypothetical protein
MKNFFSKNLEIKGLLLIMIIFSTLLIIFYSSITQLPSPVYGGDFYHQLGSVHHVRWGGNPFVSFSTLGNTPSYLPLYPLIVGRFAKLLSLPPLFAMYLFSLVFLNLGFLISYKIFSKLFNKKIALLSTLIYPTFTVLGSGILKYKELAILVMTPLFFLTLLRFFNKRDYLSSSLVGITFGLASITHVEPFFLLSIILGIIFLYLTLFIHYNKGFDKEAIIKDLKKNIIHFIIIFGIGFLISLIYWFIPIKTILFGSKGMGFESPFIYTIPYLLKKGTKMLLPINNIFNVLISLFTVFGLGIQFFIKKSKKVHNYLISSCLILFLLPFHYLITKPLFGFTLFPEHVIMHSFPIIRILLSSLGIYYFLKLFKKEKLVFIFTFAILLITLTFSVIDYQINSDAMGVGKMSLPPYMLDAQQWIIDNTDVNDVFVTTKESATLVNSLTGRKAIALRINHVSKFDNVMQREADLAVILYGNNNEKRQELLKKYNVKYLYWDNFWISSEFLTNTKGEFITYFDPILILDTKENRAYYEKNGVEYKPEFMELSSSKRGVKNVIKERLLVALPPRKNAFTPWSEDLDKYLEEKYRYEENGNKIALIFEIKNEDSN